MNIFSQIQDAGFNAKKILSFLSKKNSHLGSKIQSLLASGFTAEKILDFLGKPQNFEKMKNQIVSRQFDQNQAENPLIQAEEIKRGNLSQDLGNRLSKGLKKGLATAASAYGISKALPLISGMLNGNQEVSESPLQPPQKLIKEAGEPGIDLSSQDVIPENTHQVSTPPIVSSSDIIRTARLDPLIDSMAKDNIKADDIAQYIQEAYPDHTKNIEEKTKEPLVNSIYRYLGKKPKTPKLVEGLENQFKKEYGNANALQENENQVTKSERTSTELQSGNESQEVEKIAEAPRKNNEKGNVVLLPNGEIGTLEEVKKDHAVISVDGKKKPIKLDQVQDIPIQHKELADLHDELIKGIEKETGQDVSRNVMWAGYDPDANKLEYLPWDGSLYTYDNIDKKYIDRLTSLLTKRKSTGSNFIGSWSAGSDSPIGAEMYQIIKELQAERGGKGKEYSGKAQPIYNAFEPALKAKKEKLKKMKDEEKRRKEKR